MAYERRKIINSFNIKDDFRNYIVIISCPNGELILKRELKNTYEFEFNEQSKVRYEESIGAVVIENEDLSRNQLHVIVYSTGKVDCIRM